ncbi:MAG: exoribonuclease II [Succinivibrio sp.]|nr:exoribonuclease II [Succinivibrio sp.]
MLIDNPALMQLKQNFDSQKIKKEGVVKATDRGFGFLEVDRESYFIAPNDMQRVTHGDRVSCVIEDDGKGKQKAKPDTLIEPFLTRFVGRVLFIKGNLFVIPDHPNISIKIRADDHRKGQRAALQNKDWVVCKLTEHALAKHNFRCEITEFICSYDDPQTPWTVTLRSYDLPLTEPADEDLPFLESSLPREDLTSLHFVTIDSEHTQDMDDALYLEQEGDKYILYTAIADPTGYIAAGSKLDHEAAVRDFSIYLPGRDIPMLPRILSCNLCSLRPDEERPALVGRFVINADGSLDHSATTFKLATIKSKYKLAYNTVSDYLEGKAEQTLNPEAELEAQLRLFVRFAELRDNYRCTHAAAFMNRPDYEFVLNEAGALDHIEVNYRRIANRIVEESMVAANIACGEYLATHLHHGIFNTHKGFDLSRKKEIFSLLDQEHVPYDPQTFNTLEGYNEIRRYAVSQQNNYLDSRIRHLQEYSQMSITPEPHYALGVENYATWTSPIRKFGDMINHRLIKALILNEEHPALPDEQTLLSMNNARRLNRMCERDVRDWLYVEYLRPEIEKKTVFTAEIFDINRSGLKVLLQENGAMVFVPQSLITANREALSLDGDQGTLSVNGEVKLRLADLIKIRIVEVDIKNRSITGAAAEPVGGLLLPEYPSAAQARR